MTDQPRTRRRWFQFGLGTMFVIVTLPAIFLGWRAYCLDWIRQRKEWLEGPKPTNYLHMVGNGQPPPWYLRMFGETQGWQAVSMRFVPWTEPEPELTEEQLVYYRQLRRLFPEAAISTSPLDSRRPPELRTVP